MLNGGAVWRRMGSSADEMPRGGMGWNEVAKCAGMWSGVQNDGAKCVLGAMWWDGMAESAEKWINGKAWGETVGEAVHWVETERRIGEEGGEKGKRKSTPACRPCGKAGVLYDGFKMALGCHCFFLFHDIYAVNGKQEVGNKAGDLCDGWVLIGCGKAKRDTAQVDHEMKKNGNPKVSGDNINRTQIHPKSSGPDSFCNDGENRLARCAENVPQPEQHGSDQDSVQNPVFLFAKALFQQVLQQSSQIQFFHDANADVIRNALNGYFSKGGPVSKRGQADHKGKGDQSGGDECGQAVVFEAGQQAFKPETEGPVFDEELFAEPADNESQKKIGHQSKTDGVDILNLYMAKEGCRQSGYFHKGHKKREKKDVDQFAFAVHHFTCAFC